MMMVLPHCGVPGGLSQDVGLAPGLPVGGHFWGDDITQQFRIRKPCRAPALGMGSLRQGIRAFGASQSLHVGVGDSNPSQGCSEDTVSSRITSMSAWRLC